MVTKSGRKLGMGEGRHVAPVQTNAIVDPPCECAVLRRRPSLSVCFAQLDKPPAAAMMAPSTRTVDVHVAWLGHKLEDDPKHPRWIVTARGLGYKFAG